MKATVVQYTFGIFGFGEVNELVNVALFSKTAREAAEKIRRIEVGEVIEEVVKTVKNLQNKGYDKFIFEDSVIARKARNKLNADVKFVEKSEAGALLRRNIDKFAVDIGFVKENEEIHKWIHEVSIELTKIRLKYATEKRDLVIIQAIQMVDDIDKTLNLLVSRLRSWYGLHFPELERIIEKHETYSRLIANLGARENFTLDSLKSEELPEIKAKKTESAAMNSIGSKLENNDIDQIQAMCKTLLNLYDTRRSLEIYLDDLMNQAAPNILALAGPLLGARLIALAGGIKKMALMPSSTIQLLGAEKALFRSLRTSSPPPKHGIIFQHPFLQKAKYWQRGKVARALAGKLAIAARIDTFGSGKVNQDFIDSLSRRVNEIQEKCEMRPKRKSY